MIDSNSAGTFPSPCNAEKYNQDVDPAFWQPQTYDPDASPKNLSDPIPYPCKVHLRLDSSINDQIRRFLDICFG